MGEPTIEERIRVILAETFPERPDLAEAHDSNDLFHDMGLNSFSMISLLVGLEEEFDIIMEIDDMTAERVRSIAAIKQTLTRYLRLPG